MAPPAAAMHGSARVWWIVVALTGREHKSTLRHSKYSNRQQAKGLLDSYIIRNMINGMVTPATAIHGLPCIWQVVKAGAGSTRRWKPSGSKFSQDATKLLDSYEYIRRDHSQHGRTCHSHIWTLLLSMVGSSSFGYTGDTEMFRHWCFVASIMLDFVCKHQGHHQWNGPTCRCHTWIHQSTVDSKSLDHTGSTGISSDTGQWQGMKVPET